MTNYLNNHPTLEERYMDEEQKATLSIWCDVHYGDLFGDVWDPTKERLKELLQEYVDTGGDEAGGYIKCTPNIIKFIDVHYDHLKPFYDHLKTAGLYRMDVLEWMLTQYREYIFQTSNH